MGGLDILVNNAGLTRDGLPAPSPGEGVQDRGPGPVSCWVRWC